MNYSVVFPLVLLSVSALASERSTLAFSIDNDSVFGTDEDYTNGLFFSYTSGKISPYPAFKPLSLSYWKASSLDKIEIQLGHKMWTPSDINSSKPVANDRPYAGYFYAELNYISLHPQQAQRFNLTIGATGESSFADRAQKLVHSITRSTEPKGWEYQIEDQAAGSIGYLTHFNLQRQSLSEHTSWEISNVTETNIGNFRSDLSTGAMFRWGKDLSGSFGSANISSENPFKAGMIGASNTGWFGYLGAKARYRFNDLTIQGDRPGIPEPSAAYNVTLEPLQAEAIVGVTWYNQYIGISTFLATKSSEYKEAPRSIYTNGGMSMFAFF
ncbi:exonuclease [Vibrio sp. 10N.286.49.C2]|uniref:lipid A deacylase LpxR family protein n=1 Tax=unclassified Vibrio TaxID=2614977 RepID=UPI000C826FAC|nr:MULTISPECIES: lipid A deacylase LpxR family protein [unclassified Vibrio]PMH37757.1 exonuclease [Vibrio sp. 10N.286.49.C2]PMH45078.1 exonuclease [Vibrio sp. 10N.286.49.B1]PMH81226.1 exonuclease [Vibrio sp. 10N.286.48.B7]